MKMYDEENIILSIDSIKTIEIANNYINDSREIDYWSGLGRALYNDIYGIVDKNYFSYTFWSWPLMILPVLTEVYIKNSGDDFTELVLRRKSRLFYFIICLIIIFVILMIGYFGMIYPEGFRYIRLESYTLNNNEISTLIILATVFLFISGLLMLILENLRNKAKKYFHRLFGKYIKSDT